MLNTGRLAAHFLVLSLAFAIDAQAPPKVDPSHFTGGLLNGRAWKVMEEKLHRIMYIRGFVDGVLLTSARDSFDLELWTRCACPAEGVATDVTTYYRKHPDHVHLPIVIVSKLVAMKKIGVRQELIDKDAARMAKDMANTPPFVKPKE